MPCCSVRQTWMNLRLALLARPPITGLQKTHGTLKEYQAAQAVARSKRQLALAQKKHGYAQDRLHLAQRAFELGEMGLYQLLLARQQAARAERELELRQLETLRDLAKQHHALGVIPK